MTFIEAYGSFNTKTYFLVVLGSLYGSLLYKKTPVSWRACVSWCKMIKIHISRVIDVLSVSFHPYMGKIPILTKIFEKGLKPPQYFVLMARWNLEAVTLQLTAKAPENGWLEFPFEQWTTPLVVQVVFSQNRCNGKVISFFFPWSWGESNLIHFYGWFFIREFPKWRMHEVWVGVTYIMTPEYPEAGCELWYPSFLQNFYWSCGR